MIKAILWIIKQGNDSGPEWQRAELLSQPDHCVLQGELRPAHAAIPIASPWTGETLKGVIASRKEVEILWESNFSITDYVNETELWANEN